MDTVTTRPASGEGAGGKKPGARRGAKVGPLFSDGSTPTRLKRRRLFLLRGTLVTAVGALLINAGPEARGPAALLLLLVFALSDAYLLFLPLKTVRRVGFDVMLGLLDISLVALGIFLASGAGGALTISCFLMVLVVAMSSYKLHAVSGAAAVGALHTWLVVGSSGAAVDLRQLSLQMLFLCSVGLYYGVLTEGVRDSRRRQEADDMNRRELQALIDILGAVTSTLDLRRVTYSVVEKLAEVVPSVRCSMLFIDESREVCFVLASHEHEDLELLELDLKKYPEIRHAIETRQPVVIQDASSDPIMSSLKRVIEQLDLRSIMVVPITFGDDLLGSLFLKAARSDTEFSEREVNFCIAAAKASANALHNALVHRQMTRRTKEFEGLSSKLASILDHSPDLIMTTDTSGTVTEFSRGAQSMLDRARDEMLGCPVGTILADPRESALVTAACGGGQLAHHKTRLLRSDGVLLDVELSISALRDEAGRANGTVWVGRDVTEQRAAELRLIQAEKLSSIGEVISGIAHELNNPLSGVLGYSQMLMARHGGSPLGDKLDKIHDAATRCQSIVRNLCSFSRAEAPERAYSNLNDVVERTLELKSFQLKLAGVKISTDLDPDLPLTSFDAHQMQQVLLNLITNAEHAMREKREPEGTIRVATWSESGRVKVSVTDEGHGMTSETADRVFQPFFTTKAQGEGTGLGLSVSYGIVRQHGGRISVASAPGKGSVFTVDLPVCGAPREEPPVPPASAPRRLAAHSGGERLLVVDDEPVILDLLSDVLGAGGYEVDTAASGEEALRRLEETEYALVVSDLRMPGIGGAGLFRRAVEIEPALRDRFLFTTGDASDHGEGAFLKRIDAPVAVKPIDIHLFLEKVRETLDAVPV